MGITGDGVRLLMREGNRRNFTGKVLQLGRQEVLIDERNFKKIAREENFKLSEPKTTVEYGKSKFSNTVTLDDKFFFQGLGFEVVDSLDICNFEDANITHDLNKLLEKTFKDIRTYSLVYDGGTLEHIFHVPNALKNIFDFLAVDGRVVHICPMNHVNHGFYNFSPCFYEDFYAENKFLINECGIIKQKNNIFSNRGSLYTSGHKKSQFFRSLNPSMLDGAMFLTHFIATKRQDSTGDKVPQQLDYNNWWDTSIPLEKKWDPSLVDNKFIFKSIYKIMLAVPILKTIVKYLRDRYANYLVKWDVI